MLEQLDSRVSKTRDRHNDSAGGVAVKSHFQEFSFYIARVVGLEVGAHGTWVAMCVISLNGRDIFTPEGGCFNRIDFQHV